jgi:3-oxoacyl-[acyl-carrier protein] reductase
VNLSLDGKSFVIGGGSRGLGRAVAEALVAEGARVLLVARDEDSLKRTAAQLGEGAYPLVADLSTPEGADLVAASVGITFGIVHGVLVNTGGPPAGLALDLDGEQWQHSFDLLLGAPLRLLRGLVPQLADGSSILFVTSSSVRQPIPGLDSSNVLRPAVAALVKTLARELAPAIRVNSIAPGRIDTDRVRSLDRIRAQADGVPLDEQVARAVAAIPMGRYGEPAEFGRVAAFLLSPAASYVTGAAIQVDGGSVTAVP